MSKKSKRKSSSKSDYYEPELESDEPLSVEDRPKYRLKMVYLIDQDEVNALINASDTPYPAEPSPEVDLNYSSYSEEEVRALLDGDYKQRKFRKKK